ncbi:hypothetical protein HYW42_04930 [Candidatus Daviesbacteria bacterium]|nr:hypothetical protein [Candidatus Daviesbacteria bacterium]
MSQNLLKQLKEKLVQEEKETAKHLKKMENEQNSDNDLPETADIGSFSWQADISSSLYIIKQNLSKRIEVIQKALVKIKVGTYGVCERCQRQIKRARLEVFPSASTCGVCI